MTFARKHVTVLAVAAVLAACDGKTGDSDIYTLYRDSAAGTPKEGKAMRIHVATFDSSDGEQYNRENCQIAQGLFQNQPGVTVRYWCEKGRYKK